MTISVRLKHSSVAAKVPVPADLAEGELGLNINDTAPAIYLKDSAGAVVQVGGVGTEPDATETVKGVVELATQAEVDAGTDDTRAVTPLKAATTFVNVAGDTMIGDLTIADTADIFISPPGGSGGVVTYFRTTSNTGISDGTAPNDSSYLTPWGAFRNQTDSGANVILTKSVAITPASIDGQRRLLSCERDNQYAGGLIFREHATGSGWFNNQATFEGNLHGGLVESHRVWNTRPGSFWSAADFIGIGTSTAGTPAPYGSLTSTGSYGVSLVSNGYRNDTGGWTSHSATTSQTGAAEAKLVPSGAITFHTDASKNATSPSPTERGRFNDSGLTVSSLSGTGNRAVYSTGAGLLTNTSSDGTLKTNIQTLSSQVDVVKALNPVSFNWIDTELRGVQPEIGFIAQDVQELVPEVVGSNSDGTLTVDYPKMVATLTKALQESLTRIEDLEARIDAAGL